jgi:hypothetical protein
VGDRPVEGASTEHDGVGQTNINAKSPMARSHWALLPAP